MKICKGLLLTVVLLTVSITSAATWYVDSRTGSDSNNGQTPKTAWQTLKRVNRETNIKPGDKILLVRGGLWRETLRPHSGEEGKPVYYGAYGEGALPRLYGSVDASSKEDWSEVQPGIWATQKVEPKLGKMICQKENLKVNWWMHREGQTVVKFSSKGSSFKVDCAKSSTAGNHIQIWGGYFPQPIGDDDLVVKFRARCSKDFKFNSFAIMNGGFPYNAWFSATGTFKVTDQWQEFSTYMPRLAKDKLPAKNEKLNYHLNLGGMPSDSIFEFELLSVQTAKLDRAKLLYCDAGNLIFDHGEYTKGHRCGIKKWSLDKLQKQGDYWYNGNEQRVYLRWNGNPAADCKSIEIALRATIIDEGGCHDVIYENLAVAYGAAHGFGGGNTLRLTIRKCDIYYIGGGHQFTGANGYPVRFGNGIEFWGSCDQCVVEENRLWEIYDAALTNQGRKSDNGSDRSIEQNLIWRNNLIWNSEYSFEYWNNDVTANVLVEGNLCWNAGYGWAHGQRPDPNGGHLMFYNNKAKTTDFIVRNNVFSESTEVCIRMENDWREGLTLDNNQYYQSEKPLIRWLGRTYFGKDELKRIQNELGLEKNGKIQKFDPPVFEER